ncbi:Golgi pH regulator [Hondaea fermentalgiana]|uniref:Golgi pH regulator n=1 Tax=Hondaea fermentalgiana TaxID=2315210 RepID=A0A2R5G651_9STRA|nr:Golgi pH regulator [Hondaea fermentalgiana]|eukprot:GBG26470.1 Golgi pH regulator [Hondaea fermentalgiana]
MDEEEEATTAYGAVQGETGWLREDGGVVLVSLALPFGFAVIFFSQWLFRDYEVNSLSVQALFATTFTLSVNMQALVLFEIMGVMHAETRWFMWKVDLYSLMALLTMILPLNILWAIVKQQARGLPVRGRNRAVELQVRELRKEVETLEGFHRELFLDVNEMHLNRSQLLFSRTLRGFFHYALGYVFSGYCVYKCAIVSINILLDRDPQKDPVTRGFQIFFMFFQVDLDIHFWSQVISLVLVGVLSFASVRGFLITIAKIFHQISTSMSSNSVVLLLGQMMGMYFISFVLLLRMNLPEDYRRVVTAVLGGDLHFSFYHRFFDRIFLGSALTTSGVMYFLHRQREERTKFQTFDKAA